LLLSVSDLLDRLIWFGINSHISKTFSFLTTKQKYIFIYLVLKIISWKLYEKKRYVIMHRVRKSHVLNLSRTNVFNIVLS
jgi:hypothetical protein